jgi:hypothetical protein
MAISGKLVINVGLQNESTGSDSLFTAFNKAKTNFDTLFTNASPYNTFTGNVGINVNANASLGNVDILNTGVLSLTAGDSSINLSGSNGNITITATGGGNGGGVSSIGVNSSTLNVNTTSGGNIVSSGNIIVNLSTTGIAAGQYTNPTVTVDTFGRVTQIANANSVGTVTSIAVTPGSGIQVTGSPITTSGNINIINTGVTRLSAGSGISLSSSNGNVTVSTTPVIAVTSVGVSSSTLTVSGSPVTTTGTISVDLPANTVISGRITANTMVLAGSEDLADGGAANLLLTASYFTTASAETATLAAGTAGQVKTFMMVGDGGDMVITVTNAGWKSSGTGTMTFDAIGDSCTLQYIVNKWFCIGNNGVVFA